jgi:hypothetical protein
MEAIKAFFEDYTSYVIIGTSLLTCYEFFKSRSRILVLTVVAILLLLAVVFHNPVLNCLSGTTEVIGIYGHLVNPGTRRINWKKLSMVLGAPLAILLISRLFFPPEQMNMLWQICFAPILAPLAITLVVETGLSIITGFVIVLKDIKVNAVLAEEQGGCLVAILLIINLVIFVFYASNYITDPYYASGGADLGGVVSTVFVMALLCVSYTMAFIAINTISLVYWMFRRVWLWRWT